MPYKKQAKSITGSRKKKLNWLLCLTDELTKALGPAGLGQLAGFSRAIKRNEYAIWNFKKQVWSYFISGPLTELIKIMNNVVGKVNIVNQLDQSLSQLKKRKS